MIGRADIEGSKSNVAMNAWLPQASDIPVARFKLRRARWRILSQTQSDSKRNYLCGNFSDTSSWILLKPKRSIGHVFTVCVRTENENQASFSPFGPQEISVLIELTLRHLRYHLTDVPPQPNFPPDCVFCTNPSFVGTVVNQKPGVLRVSVQRNK